MKQKNYFVGTVMLLIAAFIWGTTFVAQSSAMSDVGPFTFTAFRSVVGGAALAVFYFLSQRKTCFVPFKKENIKNTLQGGIVCGVVLFISTNLQQIGLVNASPGKAGFITSLYIIIVPLISIFLGKRPGIIVIACAGISLVGFYLLNMTDGQGFGLSIWEILILICAFTFSLHIISVDKFSANINAVLLSCIQFWTVGILSSVFIFMDVVFLGYSLPGIEVMENVWFSVLYAGLFSSGIAYTLQIAGQKRMPAFAASLLMSLESVFAAVSAWVFSPENAMSSVQVCGCVLIFGAICISQIPVKNREQKNCHS